MLSFWIPVLLLAGLACFGVLFAFVRCATSLIRHSDGERRRDLPGVCDQA